MTTTVYRSALRTGWIVQPDLATPFRIDQRALATVCRHWSERLAAVTPEPIAVRAECLIREGDIPLVVTDLVARAYPDEVLIGLSDDSWIVVRLALIRALTEITPTL